MEKKEVNENVVKMDLSSVIAKKNEAAQFMEDEITYIIKNFDKRDPGSQGEKDAVDYMAKQLEEYCDEVVVEPFGVYPASFMSWIYISVTLVFLAMVTYFFMPIVSLVFGIVAMVIMVGQFFLYKRLVDKLFEKKTSYNITAIKKPTGEVKRRLFYNGHPDAAYEWPMVYYFGGKAMGAHLVTVFLGIGYVFAVIIAAIILRSNHIAGQAGVISVPTDIINKLGFGALAFVPSFVGMFFFWNEKRVCDGANDNLSGCYMGIAILKELKEAGIEMENTEVGVIITGSEEAGLRGAKAWAETHKGEYQDVDTFIYAYDTIRDLPELGVCTRDLNNIVKADERACELFFNAAEKLGTPVKKTTVPLGSTDSAAFNQGGFRAAGITALSHDLQKYYHTREDSYDNMDKECLATCFAISVQVLEDLENEAKED
jgi:putative aminopeptidase FrvX